MAAVLVTANCYSISAKALLCPVLLRMHSGKITFARKKSEQSLKCISLDRGNNKKDGFANCIRCVPIQLAQNRKQNEILLSIGRWTAQNYGLSGFPCANPNRIAKHFCNRQRIAQSWRTFDRKRVPRDSKVRPCLPRDLVQPSHPSGAGIATSCRPICMQLRHCASKKPTALASVVHHAKRTRLCLRVKLAQPEPSPAT